MTDFAGYGGCQNALAINVESLTSSVSVRFRTGLPEIVPEVFLKYMPSSVLTDENFGHSGLDVVVIGTVGDTRSRDRATTHVTTLVGGN